MASTASSAFVIRRRISRPPTETVAAFRALSPTTLCDVLTRDAVMDHSIRPLWPGAPRVAGPAFTVRCPPGDNLMVHAAIHRAEPGDILVIQGGDADFALSGGNVCAWAQRRGVAAFVADGAVRDLAEVRERAFPVFARGVIPIPGAKEGPGEINGPVRCGGAAVQPGDIVVADEEGIVVVPRARAAEVLAKAQAKAAADAAEDLEAWGRKHRERTEAILQRKGCAFPD
jgi:regulator of RNase E activity RraA